MCAEGSAEDGLQGATSDGAYAMLSSDFRAYTFSVKQEKCVVWYGEFESNLVASLRRAAQLLTDCSCSITLSRQCGFIRAILAALDIIWPRDSLTDYTIERRLLFRYVNELLWFIRARSVSINTEYGLYVHELARAWGPEPNWSGALYGLRLPPINEECNLYTGIGWAMLLRTTLDGTLAAEDIRLGWSTITADLGTISVTSRLHHIGKLVADISNLHTFLRSSDALDVRIMSTTG